MKSYCGTGLGYNMDKGGSNKNHSRKLSDEQILEIKDILRNSPDQSFLDIEEKY